MINQDMLIATSVSQSKKGNCYDILTRCLHGVQIHSIIIDT